MSKLIFFHWKIWKEQLSEHCTLGLVPAGDRGSERGIGNRREANKLPRGQNSRSRGRSKRVFHRFKTCSLYGPLSITMLRYLPSTLIGIFNAIIDCDGGIPPFAEHIHHESWDLAWLTGPYLKLSGILSPLLEDLRTGCLQRSQGYR